MAPKKLVFTKNVEEEEEDDDEQQTQDEADEDPSALLPRKKTKFGAPRERVGSEPGENESACSSPSVSGFIVMPAVKPSGNKKKTPSSKVFSNEDEIALLKGLALFWANGRNNKWAEFHLFVKDDLTNQLSKIQVSEKIRSLKRKFETNVERARANGGRFDFSDSHETIVFELSNALWGDEKGIIAEESRKIAENEDEEANKVQRKRKEVDEHVHGGLNKKKRKRKQLKEHGKKSEILEEEKEVDEDYDEKKQGEELDEDNEENNAAEKGKEVMGISKEDFESAFPLLYASFDTSGYPNIVKEKCILIPREKARKLEEKWTELKAEALRLELKKIDLIKRDLQDNLQRM